MAQATYPLIMRELKLRLRRLNVSYARLAKLLDVPESTLKKWFTAKTGAFDRVTMVCEAIGVPLEVVVKSIEHRNVKKLTFSKEQQTLFRASPTAFRVFWLLVYERRSVEETRRRLELSTQEMRGVLLKLDKVRLVQLRAGDEVRVPGLQPVAWEFKGPFMEELHRDWIRTLLAEATASRDGRQLLQFYQLSPASAEELKKDLLALEEKYARRTILDLGSTEEIVQYRYLCALAFGSFVNSSSDATALRREIKN